MAMVRDNFVPGVLNPGDIMDGSKNDKLFSPNSDYFLVMQNDNNLVLYKVGDNAEELLGCDRNLAIWATGTNSGTPGIATAQITQDGALEVLFKGESTPAWSSAETVPPIPGSILRVQNDGGLRIYTHKDCWKAHE